MFLRKYCIPLTVFVIAIAGVSLYYLQPPPDPVVPVVIDKPVEPLAKPTEQPSAKAPIAETAQGGDDREQVAPRSAIVSVEKPAHSDSVRDEMGLISAEEIDAQEKARRAFYASHGLEPPPPGYRYAKLGDGAPQLVKDKDPIINVVWGEGYRNYHQLTADELAIYSCLRGIEEPSVIKRYGLSQEEVEFGLVWKQELYEKTKGPRPTITAHLSYPSSNPFTDEEEQALRKRMRDLEHELVPRHQWSDVDYDFFDTIIADIRETLSRR